MDLVERFRYIMKINQLTASAFAQEIGVQASSVSHVLSGRNKPSLEFIQKIVNRYPKVDATWLINGKPSSKILVEKQVEEKEPAMKEERIREHPEKSPELKEEKVIERILVFYSDKTFEEYNSMP